MISDNFLSIAKKMSLQGGCNRLIFFQNILRCIFFYTVLTVFITKNVFIALAHNALKERKRQDCDFFHRQKLAFYEQEPIVASVGIALSLPDPFGKADALGIRAFNAKRELFGRPSTKRDVRAVQGSLAGADFSLVA